LNGGPVYKLSPAASLLINCDNQEEVDFYWDKLLAGGQEDMCGWLRDKFGLSWQVVPTILGKLMQDKDTRKAGNVMTAMLKMKKIMIKDLETAYNQ
jgi:predicted 3-demethylubiquinone-9 3-methyltransferase (glyoxalase superfamily)